MIYNTFELPIPVEYRPTRNYSKRIRNASELLEKVNKKGVMLYIETVIFISGRFQAAYRPLLLHWMLNKNNIPSLMFAVLNCSSGPMAIPALKG